MSIAGLTASTSTNTTSSLSVTRTRSLSLTSSRTTTLVVVRPMSTASFIGYATGVDPGTVTQVLAAGSAATAIAGSISASAGSKQASLSQLLSSSTCIALTDDADSFPVPSTGTLLPAIPGFFVGDPTDVTGASVAAADLATNLVVMILIFTCNVCYGSAPAVRSNFETFLTGLHSISISFLGPNMVGTAITLVRYPFPIAPLTRAIGVLTTLITFAIVGATYAACRSQVSRRSGLTFASVQLAFRQRLEYHWAVFYDAARDTETWYVRQLIFEDLGVAYIIAVLSAVYPGSTSGCTALGAAMIAVALLHLVYLAAMRPYKQLIDAVFSACNGLLVFVVAILSQIALMQPGGALNFNSSVTTALATAEVLANCFFFVQTFVMSVYQLYLVIMRHRKPPKDVRERKGHDPEADLSVVEPKIALDALGIEETVIARGEATLLHHHQQQALLAKPLLQLPARVLPPPNPLSR